MNSRLSNRTHAYSRFDFRTQSRNNCLPLHILDILSTGPNILEIDSVAVAIPSQRLIPEIDEHSPSQSVGNDEQRRREVDSRALRNSAFRRGHPQQQCLLRKKKTLNHILIFDLIPFLWTLLLEEKDTSFSQ